MSVAQGIIETSTKGKLMEYGKLAELAKIVFGYETIEQAEVAVGKLLYSGSSDQQITRLADLLIETIKENN
jgi:hypothetical protein